MAKRAKPGADKAHETDREKGELNAKQARFVAEYLIDLNATKAAIRAGYSEKTARAIACKLLTKADIACAISEAKEKRSEETGVTAARVVEELGLIAFADIGECIRVDEHGRVTVRPLDKLDPKTRRAIAEISQQTTEIPSMEAGPDGEPAVRTIEKVRLGIKHHSKVKALELLMDHLGMRKLQHELTGKDGGPIEVGVALSKLAQLAQEP